MAESRCVAVDLPVDRVSIGPLHLVPFLTKFRELRMTVLWDSCLHDGVFEVYFLAGAMLEIRARLQIFPCEELSLTAAEQERVVCAEFVEGWLVLRYAETHELGYPCNGTLCQVLVEPRGSEIVVSNRSADEPVDEALTVSAVDPVEVARDQRLSWVRAVAVSRLRRGRSLGSLTEETEMSQGVGSLVVQQVLRDASVISEQDSDGESCGL